MLNHSSSLKMKRTKTNENKVSRRCGSTCQSQTQDETEIIKRQQIRNTIRGMSCTASSVHKVASPAVHQDRTVRPAPWWHVHPHHEHEVEQQICVVRATVVGPRREEHLLHPLLLLSLQRNPPPRTVRFFVPPPLKTIRLKDRFSWKYRYSRFATHMGSKSTVEFVLSEAVGGQRRDQKRVAFCPQCTQSEGRYLSLPTFNGTGRAHQFDVEDADGVVVEHRLGLDLHLQIPEENRLRVVRPVLIALQLKQNAQNTERSSHRKNQTRLAQSATCVGGGTNMLWESPQQFERNTMRHE